MEIQWAVEDGYVGHGPQSIEIPDDEMRECDTVEEVMEQVEEWVMDDFRNNVSWRFLNYGATKEWATKLIESRKKAK